MDKTAYIRADEIRRRLGGIGATTFYLLRKNDPTFPAPVDFGAYGGLQWVDGEVDAWLATRRDRPPLQPDPTDPSRSPERRTATRRATGADHQPTPSTAAQTAPKCKAATG
jgi:predicted DNA-binding transcriptional regulator AlpA